MKRNIFFALAIFGALALDQAVKFYILRAIDFNTTMLHTNFIDIVLVLNKGIAFSMLGFIGEGLKWLICALFCIMFVVIIKSREFFEKYPFALGAIFGAGASNLIDRFIHGGVIDYIFWHFGFNFAVFNIADATINVCIAWIIIHHFFAKKLPKFG